MPFDKPTPFVEFRADFDNENAIKRDFRGIPYGLTVVIDGEWYFMPLEPTSAPVVDADSGVGGVS